MFRPNNLRSDHSQYCQPLRVSMPVRGQLPPHSAPPWGVGGVGWHLTDTASGKLTCPVIPAHAELCFSLAAFLFCEHFLWVTESTIK